jgi:hypothetical protein
MCKVRSDNAGTSAVSDRAMLAQETAKATLTDAGMEFTSKEGGFRVLMPGMPNLTTTKYQQGGEEVLVHMYTAGHGGKEGFGCAVVFFDFPAEVLRSWKTDDLLDAAVLWGATTRQADLDTQRTIRIDSNPGREALLRSKFGTTKVRGRVYLVGPRLYAAVVLSDGEQVLNKEAVRFLDSFQLVKK